MVTWFPIGSEIFDTGVGGFKHTEPDDTIKFSEFKR
jgi:hypothetical protein